MNELKRLAAEVRNIGYSALPMLLAAIDAMPDVDLGDRLAERSLHEDSEPNMELAVIRDRQRVIAERDAAETAARELYAALEGAVKIINNPNAPIAFTAHYGPKINAALTRHAGYGVKP